MASSPWCRWLWVLLLAGCDDYPGAVRTPAAAEPAAAGSGGHIGSPVGRAGAGGASVERLPDGGDGGGAGFSRGGAGGAAPPRGLLEASCDSVDPACGGDLVGTWTVADSCVSVGGELYLANLTLLCESTPITDGALTAEGTLTFLDDGTYADTTRWTGEIRFDLGHECEPWENLGRQDTLCQRMADFLTNVGLYAQGLEYSSVQCESDPTGELMCSCTAAVDHQNDASGTYEIEEGRITTVQGGEDSYCIEGDVMALTPEQWPDETTENGPGVTRASTQTGTVVFTR